MACPPLLRELGQRIRDVVHSKEARQILDDFGARSWTSGGCQILAQSIMAWLGDVAPVFLISENGHEHTLVRIGKCYLDADGASTEKQLLKRWKGTKKVKHIKLEDARWRSPYPQGFDEARCQVELIHRMAEILHQEIGPGMEILQRLE